MEVLLKTIGDKTWCVAISALIGKLHRQKVLNTSQIVMRYLTNYALASQYWSLIWSCNIIYRKEHKSHSGACDFLKWKKNNHNMTIRDLIQLEGRRQYNMLVSFCSGSMSINQSNFYSAKSPAKPDSVPTDHTYPWPNDCNLWWQPRSVIDQTPVDLYVTGIF